MRVVFISNYYNHHQSQFSESMSKILDGEFVFVQTEEMSDERKKSGWNINDLPTFVFNMRKDNINECINIVNSADIVIKGSGPEQLIRDRLIARKIVFRYSERIFKKSNKLIQWPARVVKNSLNDMFSNNVYLLSASAYAPYDYYITGKYNNKSYKWGYFPEAKKYDNVKKMIEEKKKNSLLWVSRFINLKHPEIPILIAKRLKEEGYDFSLNMIGIGPNRETAKALIQKYGLTQNISLLESMAPSDVRKHMEESEIFIFTSNFEEGWGAVVNEAMNSACAVVTSHAVGSAPYLIKNTINGLVYANEDVDDCYSKVKYLLDNDVDREKLGKNAYNTIVSEWNASIATERLVKLCEAIINGDRNPDIFIEGPCSKAKLIKNDWYKANYHRNTSNE